MHQKCYIAAVFMEFEEVNQSMELCGDRLSVYRIVKALQEHYI